MLRKIISLIIAVLMLFVFFCGCKEKVNEGSSSVCANSEIVSVPEGNDDESQEPEESSENSETESWGNNDFGDEESNYSESEIETENEHQIKPGDTAANATSSTNSTTVTNPTSSTTSTTVTNPNIKEINTIYTIGYHFDPSWCKALGTSDEARYSMWERFLKEDYFNCIITDPNHMLNEKTRELIKKYDVTFWLMNYSWYNSSSVDSYGNPITIDMYLENNKSKQAVEIIKQDPELWNRFLGFHTEENIFRGQTNEDFLTETKGYYLLAGKRLFMCCATSEYTDKEDNFEIQYNEAERNDLKQWACKYVTDAGFDSYGHDVRPGITTSDATIEKWKGRFPRYPDFASVTNENANREYYKMHTHALQIRVGHPVYAWYFPSGYYHYIGNGLNGQRYSDEAFCLGHLKHFVELIETYNKYKGGVAIYGFAEGSNADKDFLVRHLVCENEYGKSFVFPEDTKWTTYSEYLKALTKRWRNTEIEVLDYKQYTE